MISKADPWKGFWQLADPKIWTASLVPFALGQTIAWSKGYLLRWDLLLIAVSVLILIEIGKNGLNEYFDYQSGADRFVEPKDRTAFSGGKKVIVDQLLTLRDVRLISIFSLLAAALLSLLILAQQPKIFFFAIAGCFLAIAYSVPPLRLSYRGFGEISVALAFGPIVVNGSYFLQTGRLDLEAILLSIPLAFLIANVLWINQIPDVEADRKAHKWNLVARVGRHQAITGYVLLYVAAAASIIIASLVLAAPRYLIALGGFLLTPGAIRSVQQNYDDSQKLMKAMGRTILIYLLTGLLLSLAALFFRQ